MKKIIVKISLVAAMGLIFLSQVNAQSSEGRFPFSSLENVCGDVVEFDGLFHVVVNEVISNSGNITAKFHINAKGTGVGQTSGAVYQWNDAINETLNLSKGGNLTRTQTFSLVSQGKTQNFKGHLTYHITVNANGEVTTEFENLSVECK